MIPRVAGPMLVLALCTASMSASGQALRIENEYKLTVPVELTEPVWDYLQHRYENVQGFLGQFGGHFRAFFADELYYDQYFDTPDMTLLNMQGGIRHRARFIIAGEDTSKHGRELIQIKLDRPGDLEVNRTEIKFPVRSSKQVRRLDDAHRLIGLIRRDRRGDFHRAVAELGIDAEELQPAILLEQRRRRVYINRDGAAFATLTLDEVSTRQWWRTVTYTEIELELNENAYTVAGQSQRDAMQAINDAMKRDLREAFPVIYQDQTPKYNKAYNELDAAFLWYPAATHIGAPFEATLPIGIAAVLAAALTWTRLRSHQPPLPN